LTVIIVNYNAWPDVLRLASELEDEPEFSSGDIQITVVDNASQGPIPEQLALFPPAGLRFVARQSNGGFAAGVNTSWHLAKSPWLLLLNPDVEMTSGLAGRVLDRIDKYERRPAGPPGIVGFGLSNPDGSPQGSVGVFPSLARTIREQFIPRSRRKYQAGWRIRSGPVDWVTGACMLINSQMMAELGGMDEDFFLYHEEVALCRRAHDQGWTVEYDGSLKVVHRHPLQNREVSPKMRVITRHSKLLYFRKHLPWWQFQGLYAIVVAEASVRGFWGRLTGRREQVRAWGTIRAMARQVRVGAVLRGSDVLRMAEAVENGKSDRFHKDGTACRSKSTWSELPF
jgi:GT2 family glycosyltransferase